ncbi:50S ribosomal protein L7ae, partial [Bacillus thuringiensis]|nr:50S ribosomal protein L7ae [Bacillus thuringiensis]
MGVNSYYMHITIKELIFIHTYVTGKEIPSSQALQILEQFD